MITIILIIFAGFLNACMDVLQFKFDISIFRFLKNKQWVDPRISYTDFA